MRILALCISIFVTSASYSLAAETEAYEISGVESAGAIVAGTMTRDSSGMSCNFYRSLDQGRTWSQPEIFRHLGFKIGGNPTVAADQNGSVFRMCMSVQPDYSAGVLDMSVSSDSGITWSPWVSSHEFTGKIPDRPRLAASAASGQIALSFTEVKVSKTTLSTTCKFLRSMDQGKTWMPIPLKSVDGGQGTFVMYLRDDSLIGSWGTYKNGPIKFFSLRPNGSIFETMVVADSGVEVPSTELHVSTSTGRTILVWSDTHSAAQPTFFSFSDDGGKTWSAAIKVSDQGTMLTGDFANDGSFVFAWTEGQFSGEFVDLLEGFNFQNSNWIGTYSRIFSKNRLGEKRLVYATEKPIAPVYLGANQTILKTPSGLLGLLMDWRGGIGQVASVPFR